MVNDRISREMEDAVSKGIFPGAVVLCALNQKIVFHEAFGVADLFEKRDMRKDSIFDLASLTKPLATAMAVSKLMESGLLSFDRTIGSLINEFKASGKADITIDMLLRHTSGYPAHREYHQKIVCCSDDPRQYLRHLLIKEPLENKIGCHQVYSDLGYMVLAWIIEQTADQRLDHFVSNRIFAPLGIEDLFFIETEKKKDRLGVYGQRIVSTQHCPWRKKVLTGEVDDDNAWAVGGIEGHAGLFGDAASIYTMCCELLNILLDRPSKVLSPQILKAFVAKKNHHDMVAGFDTPSKVNSSSGRFFSRSSIGHLGFTGTSFWIDPEKSLIVIVLTNRVHPLRSNTKFKQFRPKIHDIIYSEII